MWRRDFFFRWSGKKRGTRKKVRDRVEKSREPPKSPPPPKNRQQQSAPPRNSSSASSAGPLRLFLTVKNVADDRPRKRGSRRRAEKEAGGRSLGVDFQSATPCLRRGRKQRAEGSKESRLSFVESRFSPTPRRAQAAPLFSFCRRRRGERDALDVPRGKRHAIAVRREAKKGGAGRQKSESLERMPKKKSSRASEGDVAAARRRRRVPLSPSSDDGAASRNH